MGRITHGMRISKEYEAWQHMIQRCTNPNNHAYKSYGGRGIRVCKRWLKFENFIKDVGLAPSKLHTLDRYPDNDGHYKPVNVRWATWSQQNANKRTSGSIKGKSACYWSRLLGGNRLLVTKRLARGWSKRRAITEPIQINKRRSV